MFVLNVTIALSVLSTRNARRLSWMYDSTIVGLSLTTSASRGIRYPTPIPVTNSALATMRAALVGLLFSLECIVFLGSYDCEA